MANNKATGPDEIPAELWKRLGEQGTTFLTLLFNRILRDGLPTEWRKSYLIPFFKNKGDIRLCENYRAIKLMSHTLKIWERVINNRLRKLIHLSENQCGRMPVRVKGKVYKTAVRPALIYGAECWPMKKVHTTKVHTTEMKMLRWAGGVTLADRVRNEHIRGSFKIRPIEEKLSETRLRWYGHVMRRPEEHVTRQVLKSQQEWTGPLIRTGELSDLYTVQDFIYLGSLTDGDCELEVIRRAQIAKPAVREHLEEQRNQHSNQNKANAYPGLLYISLGSGLIYYIPVWFGNMDSESEYSE
ncbi:uncharacterized protein LOC134753731 [Cydia strobilella]|uniref:uncharacterized protein LOC134753731 n=1 Tax=Cydia strobilella TaxID=1100964 RepID=UPI003005E55B